MILKMARVILFTARMEEMSRFYGEVVGLKRVCDEPGWREFAAGGVRIARFGKVRQAGRFCLCDGRDPDGNPVQLSSR